MNYGINSFVRTCMWRAFLLQTNVLFFLEGTLWTA